MDLRDWFWNNAPFHCCLFQFYFQFYHGLYLGLQLKWIITVICWLIISNNIFDDHLLPSHCYLHSEAVCYLPQAQALMNKIHPSKNIKLIVGRESISRIFKIADSFPSQKWEAVGFCLVHLQSPSSLVINFALLYCILILSLNSFC